MLQWNKITAGKVYLYSPEDMGIRRYYYITEKIGKTVHGTVITSQRDIVTISSFSATKEDVDMKTDLCTRNTYESNKKAMLKALFTWTIDSVLDVRR